MKDSPHKVIKNISLLFYFFEIIAIPLAKVPTEAAPAEVIGVLIKGNE